LLLNPDAGIDDRCIAELVAAVRCEPTAGLWGGRILRSNGTVDYSTARRLPTIGHLVASSTGLNALLRRAHIDIERAPGTADPSGPVAVGMLSGVLLMTTRSAWDELGGFDSRFFMYGEDADLCKRADSLGYRPTYVPSATAVHDAGRSSTNTIRAQLQLAGRITYINSHWTAGTARAGRVLLHMGVLTRRLARRGAVDWRLVWCNRRIWGQGYAADVSSRQAQLTALGIINTGETGTVTT
jgi:GT2 family glycosyltransferase